jgi:peptide/nickel transport system substrate-binding protein
MSKATTGVKVAALAAASALLLAACGGSDSGDTGSSDTGGEPTKGGTLTFLTAAAQILHLDPQRNYTGEDMAMAGAYLHRTLVSYTYSPDDAIAGELTPDLATDTGTPIDGGKSWEFTLRDGISWEDGAPVTCADVKYGISRTFATDIITDGPSFAITLLDIPTEDDGTSAYKGPYDGTGQELYDEAVTCSDDDKTITFNLANPAGDFNYSLTLLSFSPVREDADTGEQYTTAPLSNGPYKVETNDVGTELVLVRNENWDPASDPVRGEKAYPDEIQIQFGLSQSVITQRMIADAGDDQKALPYGDNVDPAQLSAVFNDPNLENRRIDAYNIFSYYVAINTEKVPNVKHRQAIAAAFPRADIITINGGTFAGDLADGVIKPNLAIDYQPSGMWTDLLGQAIPDNGDPEYAKQLIEESGEPMPEVTYDYGKTEVRDKEASAIVTALEKAGITVNPNPIDIGAYYGIVLDPDKQGALNWAGWGPDWLNASTVIPPLFTPSGGFPLSRYDNPEFTKKVDEALLITDRAEQGQAWAELNKEAMAEALVVPTRFGKDQLIWGSKVGGAYVWPPYASWGYPDLYVME